MITPLLDEMSNPPTLVAHARSAAAAAAAPHSVLCSGFRFRFRSASDSDSSSVLPLSFQNLKLIPTSPRLQFF
jgi:hypothetical protein